MRDITFPTSKLWLNFLHFGRQPASKWLKWMREFVQKCRNGAGPRKWLQYAKIWFPNQSMGLFGSKGTPHGVCTKFCMCKEHFSMHRFIHILSKEKLCGCFLVRWGGPVGQSSLAQPYLWPGEPDLMGLRRGLEGGDGLGNHTWPGGSDLLGWVRKVSGRFEWVE